MHRFLTRRRFLEKSVGVSGSLFACSMPLNRSANAAPARIEAPIVDEVTIREITDNANDIFLKNFEGPGLKVTRPFRLGDAQGLTLESEWGLALHVESRIGTDKRRYLLDFGFTPDVYANNLALLKIDVGRVDALIISHGHYDHIGGLIGFLETNRGKLRKEMRLYTGGEDDFCARFNPLPDGSFGNFGFPLDRQKLKGLEIQTVLSEAPIVMEGHGFTTGAVPRVTFERFPAGFVKYGQANGLGCDISAYQNHHFAASEIAGKPIPDEHWHEHATCFRLGDRGLVVISSCGHAGIINTLKRAQEVSGVQKIYALVGGFHLAPVPDDYLKKVMAELKTFDLEHVMPMHCSGQNFVDLAKQEMPEKLVLCGTGSSFTFTA